MHSPPSSLTTLDAAAIDWADVALKVGVSIVVAVVARWVVHRAIDQVVRNARGRAQRRTSGLTDRAGRVIAQATGYDQERHLQRTATMGSLLRSVASAVIFGVLALQILTLFGIDIAPILASAGVGGVALGFGAQSLVKDFLSGVFMIFEDQYGVGDVVDTGEVTGTVEEVTLRVTRLRDAQGVVWYVRNGEIVRVANKSQGWSTAQVDLPVAVSEDPRRVIDVLRSAMAELDADPAWEERLLEAPQVLGVENVVGGAMTVRILAKCAANENWAVQREVRERAVEALQRAGVKGPQTPPYAGADPSSLI